jgi:hypothetical protein
MNQNLVRSIYGRSSVKIAHFIPIGLKTWSSLAILVSDWLKFEKKSSPLKLGGTMNCFFVGMIYGNRPHMLSTNSRFAKRFQRRFKKNGQSETRIACGGHVC